MTRYFVLLVCNCAYPAAQFRLLPFALGLSPFAFCFSPVL